MSSDAGTGPPLPAEEFRALLDSVTPTFGLELPVAVTARLSGYLAELDLWRARINLTGNLSVSELVAHTAESVLASSLIPQGARVVDIGSGAGFPGLPLGIARPDLHLTLVEPRQKKCAFLRHVVRALELPNVVVFEGKVEEVGGQTFGAATTRALGRIAVWLRQGELLESGGVFLAWTTEREQLAADLKGAFDTAGAIRIPGSQRREIAAFRRRPAA